MASAVQPKIPGLDALESGLRTLKRSKLSVAHEFKTMLGAAERHHNDLKLAHLTGKAKDLVEQAQRDTKFYNILVKMLCEVKERRSGEQRQGLKKVYTWYLANKHILYAGPHFGKEHQKREAQEVLEKATTPRKPKRILSSRAGLRERAKSAPSSRGQQSRMWQDSSFDWRQDLNQGLLSEDDQAVERLDLDHDDDDYEAELQELSADMDTAQNTPHTAGQPNTATTASTDLIQEARMLSRAHASPMMTPLGEQSVNIGTSAAPSRTIVHPIPSMVNPHVTLAIKQEEEKMGLAPEAQAGFRQPVATGLPTANLAHTGSTSSLRLPSPSARSNTPVRAHHSNQTEKVTRPYSSPLVGRDVRVMDDAGRESCSPSPPRSKDRCKSASVIDWRGRVQPDTMRYKWSKTKFGGYTYLKKLQQKPVSLRSAGSTSAGKRPKTAPITMKEKWKTQKPSDQNPRVEAQAASNSMTQVDQHDVDNMITVQHILGTSDSRADSLLSLYNLDEDFLRSLRRSANVPSTGPLEYMSFVTPTAALMAEQRSQAREHPSDLLETRAEGEDRGGEAVTSIHIGEDLHIPLFPDTPLGEEEAGDAELGVNHDYLQQLVDSVSEQQHTQEGEEKEDHDQADTTIHWAPEVAFALTDDDAGEVTQVTSVVTGEKSPIPISQRSTPPQPLSLSQVWQFSPVDEEEDERQVKPGFILGPSPAQWASPRPQQQRKQVFCVDCIPMATTEAPRKVERSAGRMPGQVHSASAQMVQLSRRHAELMKRVPPPRTPPSIPLPKACPARSRHSPRVGPMMTELEHHARRVRSPRSFVQYEQRFPIRRRLKDLRSGQEVRDISSAPSPSLDSLAGTLQVCRLNLPLSRQHSYSVLSDYSQDGLQSILKQPTDPNLHPSDASLGCIDETEVEKTVKFSTRPAAALPQKPMTAPAYVSNSQQKLEGLSLPRQTSSVQSSRTGSLHSSRHSSRNSSEPNTPNGRNLARIGRPIAQVAHIPDPGEVAQAMQTQKEAAAAVDIQRIFRGYVARNAYKMLLGEERQRVEDKRRAAVEIQRMYRGHLTRKRAIERRPPDPAMLEWAHKYRVVLIAREQERLKKVEERADELSQNYHLAHSKLSVIGPHVNIYDIYHPKKTGPTKKELNMAATLIQCHVRGWLVRRRMEKLNRKAAWYGSTFHKIVKEYKSMLVRIQRQHGVERPQAPFTHADMNEYMDTRRRYESVFEKKAFGNELELADMESFFKECDLYPSQAEIESAMAAVFQGNSVAKQGRGLKRHEILDIVFHIYTPRASGLENTRRSTWMNPIIDGIEARRLLGSEFVEEAPLEPCARLVFKSRREQREKERMAERARQEAAEAERKRLEQKKEEDEEQEEEEKVKQKKQRRVTYREPSTNR